MTVATVFTLVRIALVPVFGWLWAVGRYEAALWAFGCAAISDFLDGLLARALNQRTRFGAFLDPAADKLMLLVSYLVAVKVGAVPWWLAAVVVGRDVILSVGAAVLAAGLRDRFDASRMRPTRIGKYSTMMEALTIVVALLISARFAPSLGPWLPALVVMTGVLALASGVQYVVRGIAMVHDSRRAAAATQPGAA